MSVPLQVSFLPHSRNLETWIYVLMQHLHQDSSVSYTDNSIYPVLNEGKVAKFHINITEV